MKICVWGYGLSGRSASGLLNKLNINHEIIDKNFLNEEFLLYFDKIILSPGIPLNHKKLKKAEEIEIQIVPEIDLGLKFIKGKIIAITGTNGKTTTCYLIYNIISNSEKSQKTFLAGNIGKPICDYCFREGIFVIELSSFQLHFSKKLKPFIACITNISHDHLDSHISFEEYMKDKLKIMRNLNNDSFLILNYDDENLKGIKKETNIYFVSLKKEVKGVYYDNKKFILNIENKKETIEDTFDNFIGMGNKYNISFSILISYLMGINKEKIVEVLSNLKPLPHRLEKVREKDQVLWVNDSKSTNPHSVLYALKSFNDKNIILILGGKNKFLDFGIIENEIKNKVKYLITFGEAGDMLKNRFNALVKTNRVYTVKECVYEASKIAEKGDIVLFSPGLSSFDLYKNYAERGDDFKKWVKRI